ncbi:MAG: hypothetical protein IAG13_02445 [Deltaproteobacteria bacterium]|nr:hypothetical protein [Nannocystaceae bacterium]
MLEAPGGRHEAAGSEGFAIERGLEGGELRIERGKREAESLEGRVQDGERGELWVVLERARS